MMKITNHGLFGTYHDFYWVGFSWRRTDAVCFMGGVDLKGKFRIGYSYDLTTSYLKAKSQGSHEIVLGYKFN